MNKSLLIVRKSNYKDVYCVYKYVYPVYKNAGILSVQNIETTIWLSKLFKHGNIFYIYCKYNYRFKKYEPIRCNIYKVILNTTLKSLSYNETTKINSEEYDNIFKQRGILGSRLYIYVKNKNTFFNP